MTKKLILVLASLSLVGCAKLGPALQIASDSCRFVLSDGVCSVVDTGTDVNNAGIAIIDQVKDAVVKAEDEVNAPAVTDAGDGGS